MSHAAYEEEIDALLLGILRCIVQTRLIRLQHDDKTVQDTPFIPAKLRGPRKR